VSVEDNLLTGTLPSSIGRLRELVNVRFFENCGYTKDQMAANRIDPGSCRRFTRVLLEGKDDNAPRDMCCPPFGLQGPLPVALQQCTKLATLWLDENNFGNGGPIPAWLGDMASLKYVDLFGNSFRGAVPASFGKLRKLEKLCVENNDLTGELPVDFGDRALFPELFSLDLSLNPGLTGLVTQAVGLFAKGSPGIRYECCGAPCALREHNAPRALSGPTCDRQCPDRTRGDSGSSSSSSSDPCGPARKRDKGGKGGKGSCSKNEGCSWGQFCIGRDNGKHACAPCSECHQDHDAVEGKCLNLCQVKARINREDEKKGRVGGNDDGGESANGPPVWSSEL
jgi:hypothetical protein